MFDLDWFWLFLDVVPSVTSIPINSDQFHVFEICTWCFRLYPISKSIGDLSPDRNGIHAGVIKHPARVCELRWKSGETGIHPMLSRDNMHWEPGTTESIEE